jgi:hypothetical protein
MNYSIELVSYSLSIKHGSTQTSGSLKDWNTTHGSKNDCTSSYLCPGSEFRDRYYFLWWLGRGKYQLCSNCKSMLCDLLTFVVDVLFLDTTCESTSWNVVVRRGHSHRRTRDGPIILPLKQKWLHCQPAVYSTVLYSTGFSHRLLSCRSSHTQSRWRSSRVRQRRSTKEVTMK